MPYGDPDGRSSNKHWAQRIPKADFLVLMDDGTQARNSADGVEGFGCYGTRGGRSC
jgi:hypothetical protein